VELTNKLPAFSIAAESFFQFSDQNKKPVGKALQFIAQIQAK